KRAEARVRGPTSTHVGSARPPDHGTADLAAELRERSDPGPRRNPPARRTGAASRDGECAGPSQEVATVETLHPATLLRAVAVLAECAGRERAAKPADDVAVIPVVTARGHRDALVFRAARCR